MHVLYDTYFDIASGLTLEGRPGFKRLLADCESGQIQFVLTKSTSRFSRDIVVALQAIQKLATTGVTVPYTYVLFKLNLLIFSNITYPPS